MNNIINSKNIFENIKHIDDEGGEFWYARELQIVIDYKEWRKFEGVIRKAMIACKMANNQVIDHFVQVDKMVDIGSKTKRFIRDYKLSRFACYLIAQNGDSSLSTVSLAQTYFAVQTRKQELFDKDYEMMSEEEKRLYQRDLTKKGNTSLNTTASKAGVSNFAQFHNAGYMGLYNGETADDIAKRKGLKYREQILDNMGSEELADNLFRIVQTNNKIKKDNIQGQKEADAIHYKMGKDIREFISKLGGTMPEDLPTPKKSLKEINNNKQIDFKTD